MNFFIYFCIVTINQFLNMDKIFFKNCIRFLLVCIILTLILFYKEGLFTEIFK